MPNDPLLQPTPALPKPDGDATAPHTKVCLVIIFNHKFDGNLPALDRIYRDRFPHIRYLVPFYRGERPDVYPVYYSSFQFQGFFRTAWERLRGEGFTHFFFLGDDMILNPRVTAENLCSRLRLDGNSGYLKNCWTITDGRMNWFPFTSALISVAGSNGVNWMAELPDPAVARENLAAKGYPMGKFGWHNFRHGTTPKTFFQMFFYLAHRFKRWRQDRREGLLDPPYPLVHGHADFLVIPAAFMEKFCAWSSVLAAMGVFVEVAAPTALALSCPRVVTEADIGFPSIDWAFLVEPRETYCRPFDHDIDKLLDGFDENVLYLHPIKLSQWHFSS